MVDILTQRTNASRTSWRPLNSCSHQQHIFRCFTYLRRSYFPVLSKLPVSSNRLTHIQTVFASVTALLHEKMNLCQKILASQSQICCFQNTPAQQILDTSNCFQILPILPNCLVRSAAPCSRQV